MKQRRKFLQILRLFIDTTRKRVDEDKIIFGKIQSLSIVRNGCIKRADTFAIYPIQTL